MVISHPFLLIRSSIHHNSGCVSALPVPVAGSFSSVMTKYLSFVQIARVSRALVSPLLLCIESNRIVPIVLVFTQYDKLVKTKELQLFRKNPGIEDEELTKQAQEAANVQFLEDCDLLIKRAQGYGIPWVRVSSELHRIPNSGCH